MKQLTGSLLLLCVCVPLAAGDADPKRRAKEQAQAMVNAILKEDVEKFMSYLPARAVKLAGGREKLIASTKALLEKAKSRGFKVESVAVGDPTDMVGKGQQLFVIIPTRQVMTGPGVKFTDLDHLIGSSEDGGKTWTFINRANMTREGIRELLPNLSDELKLPPPQKRTVEKTN